MERMQDFKILIEIMLMPRGLSQATIKSPTTH